MEPTHKIVLYLALGFLAFSLIVPGLIEIFKAQAGNTKLIPASLEAKNQLRALNGMMVGVGCIAIWACIELEHSRDLVLALAGILLIVVNTRLYSSMIDGFPDLMTCVYTIIEIILALLFLLWPPFE